MARGDIVIDAARNARLDDQIAVAMRGVFEPRLIEIGLGGRQIAEQNLDELRVSLQLVDDIIARPDSFGTIGLTFSAGAGMIIARAAAEGSMKVTILPLALQRKLLVLERIRALIPVESLQSVRSEVAAAIPESEIKEKVLGLIEEGLQAPEPQEGVETVRNDVASGVPDSAIKDQVLGLLDTHIAAIRRETVRREAEAAQAAEARTAAAAAAAASLPNPLSELLVKQQISSQRSDMYKSWFNRETVASAVGPIVMLSLVGALIIAMFTHTPIVPVVSDSFLLVLGYFFGNATAQGSLKAPKRGDDGDASLPETSVGNGSGSDDGNGDVG